ncbi:hypothetical protein [Nocardia wallacei]|uniref:hypothetical protein n=1 Tax=Nocardia wallacei TaxID=480035 RepID=UPI0024548D88|nr:hypothetical protein [Nocardia wallacei]
MRDDQSAGNAETSYASAEIAALAQRVATARGKLPLQTDPALFDELSESEIAAERDLAEWIRAQRRRQRRGAVAAELAAEKRDRRVERALRRADDADARWHRKALAARRRVSNPDARLAQLYRRAEWSSRALIGVVVLGMVWAGVNVQQNLVPSGDMSDPLYWLSYGFEAMISIPIITIMVVATTAARWGREIARGKVVFLEAALLGVTIALNAGPHLANGAPARAAEAAVAPVMVGVVIWLHAWVSARYAQLIDAIPDHSTTDHGRTVTHRIVDAFAVREGSVGHRRLPTHESHSGPMLSDYRPEPAPARTEATHPRRNGHPHSAEAAPRVDGHHHASAAEMHPSADLRSHNGSTGPTAPPAANGHRTGHGLPTTPVEHNGFHEPPTAPPSNGFDPHLHNLPVTELGHNGFHLTTSTRNDRSDDARMARDGAAATAHRNGNAVHTTQTEGQGLGDIAGPHSSDLRPLEAPTAEQDRDRPARNGSPSTRSGDAAETASSQNSSAEHPYNRRPGSKSAAAARPEPARQQRSGEASTQLALDDPAPVDVAKYRQTYTQPEEETEAAEQDSDDHAGVNDLAAEIDDVGVWAVAREISERRLSKLSVEQLAEVLTLADESWTPAAIGASIGLPGSRILGILEAARRIRRPYAISG